jgi:hypothetical protein
MQPPARATVGKNVGLHLSWFVYRAPSDAPVTFDPVQIKAWEDTRAGANSPWSPIWTAPPMPADGKISGFLFSASVSSFSTKLNSDELQWMPSSPERMQRTLYSPAVFTVDRYC